MIIDMHCNVGVHFDSCDKEKCALLLSCRDDLIAGGTAQRNTILIRQDIKIIATRRGSISSTTACFWLFERVRAVIEGLSMMTHGSHDIDDGNCSPVFVNSGFAKLTNCSLVSDGMGYSSLVHGEMNEFYDCQLSSPGFSVFHFNAPHCERSIVIRGCTIEHTQGWAFMEDQEAEDDWCKTFREKVSRENTITYIDMDDHDFDMDDDYGNCG